MVLLVLLSRLATNTDSLSPSYVTSTCCGLWRRALTPQVDLTSSVSFKLLPPTPTFLTPRVLRVELPQHHARQVFLPLGCVFVRVFFLRETPSLWLWIRPWNRRTRGGPTSKKGQNLPRSSGSKRCHVASPRFLCQDANAPHRSYAGRRTRSGQQYSPFWGKPIQCPVEFSTVEAVARAEAHAAAGDEDDQLELETPSDASPLVEASTHTAPAEQMPPPPPLPTRLTKNQKKNLKDRRVRNAARELRRGGPKACSEKYWTSAKNRPLNTQADAAHDLPHSKPAWIGLRERKESRHIYGLVELREKFGLRLFEWDGK